MRLRSTGMGVKMLSSEAYLTAGERAYYLLIEYQTILLKNFRNKVKEILDQYNFNNSEIMTDYFHVNFYSHFYLDSDLENKYKDQLLSKEAA